MTFVGVAAVIIGYGLFYTGLCDFSGHNIGLFQAFGYQGTKGPKIDSIQYTYQTQVPSGPPAQALQAPNIDTMPV